MYHLQELFLTVFPTLDEIVKMGIVPRPDEIVEFSAELYELYEMTYSKFGPIKRPLYTIETTERRIGKKIEPQTVLRAEQVAILKHSVEILGEYAKTKGIDTDNRVAFFKFLQKDFHPMVMLREIDAVVDGYKPVEEHEADILAEVDLQPKGHIN